MRRDASRGPPAHPARQAHLDLARLDRALEGGLLPVHDRLELLPRGLQQLFGAIRGGAQRPGERSNAHAVEDGVASLLGAHPVLGANRSVGGQVEKSAREFLERIKGTVAERGG